MRVHAKLTMMVPLALLGMVFGMFAQQPSANTGKAKAPPPRPDAVFFQENWTAKTNEHVSVSQASLGNPNLELKLYGSGKDMDTVAENGGPLHVYPPDTIEGKNGSLSPALLSEQFTMSGVVFEA